MSVTTPILRLGACTAEAEGAADDGAADEGAAADGAADEGAADEGAAAVGAADGDGLALDPHAEMMMAVVAPSAISRFESCNAYSSIDPGRPSAAGPGHRLAYARIGWSGIPNMGCRVLFATEPQPATGHRA